ncbi:hypothetical protein [uncultured Campylobacter sp.]|uniref:hypothetical protein n=1 Tax=uncultured Campylobacter sp. TaxID=218934 RepID=UPI003211C576
MKRILALLLLATQIALFGADSDLTNKQLRSVVENIQVILGVILFFLILKILFKKKTTSITNQANGNNSEDYICTTCHSRTGAHFKRKYSIGWFWVIFIFISMGLGLIIYFLIGKKENVCPVCGAKTLVPTNTPIGQQILKNNTNNLS